MNTTPTSIPRNKEQIRSTPLNNYYWGAIVTTLSKELGYTKYEMHEVLKAIFLTEKKFVEISHGRLMETSRTGSTTTISIPKFIEFVKRIRNWSSADMGIYLPKPNEII